MHAHTRADSLSRSDLVNKSRKLTPFHCDDRLTDATFYTPCLLYRIQLNKQCSGWYSCFIFRR
jgi:hypothetical protein